MISQICTCRLIQSIIAFLWQMLPKLKWYIHELLQKHIHNVKFYPSADNFTLALLVTNITSAPHLLACVIPRMQSD